MFTEEKHICLFFFKLLNETRQSILIYVLLISVRKHFNLKPKIYMNIFSSELKLCIWFITDYFVINILRILNINLTLLKMNKYPSRTHYIFKKKHTFVNMPNKIVVIMTNAYLLLLYCYFDDAHSSMLITRAIYSQQQSVFI